jgi:adenine deaminase
LLARGLCVTINSDDPAYFGGYVNENFLAAQRALGLTQEEIHRLARNSFEASFLSDGERRRFIDELDAVAGAAVSPSPNVVSPRA